jgi:hypothetical protein
MPAPLPSVGRIVHYVSYGTPGGEFTPECRAAIITAVEPPEQHGPLADMNAAARVSLAVLNPTGTFFNQGCVHHEAEGDGQQEPGGGALNHPGGTWHWPERV